ncbi:alpha/beta hydrolase [Bacillus sp. BGMRC 2118]|nr:alpha/beta hydrolase [Bacillus sp. BGMRC 2118]
MINLLKVNNKNIEVLQKGSVGRVIVILTGMGCSFHEWHEIVESISETSRVIMFHRPGLGESEIGNETRNTNAVVNELYEILKLLSIEKPILLVGHSYGGLCAQHFVKLYPNKVAGLLLVDSTSVDLKVLDELDTPMLNEVSTDDVWMEKCKSYSTKTRNELYKIIKPGLSQNQKQLPSEIQKHLIDFQVNPNLYKAMYLEMDSWKADALTIKEISSNLDIPLIILGRDREYSIKVAINDGLPEDEVILLEDTWSYLIGEQSELSKRSEVIFVKGSGHSIHLDKPDIVIGSISKLLI